MNQDIILGIIRHVLTIGCGFLVAKGKLDSNGSETLVGSLMGVIGVVWSMLHKQSTAVAAAVASVTPAVDATVSTTTTVSK